VCFLIDIELYWCVPVQTFGRSRSACKCADSDDLARVYRFDLAQDSEMISPAIPILMSPGREAFWQFGFWHR
jgi:hypothetical protein